MTIIKKVLIKKGNNLIFNSILKYIIYTHSHIYECLLVCLWTLKSG